jgi:hypothetical protein
MYASRKMIPVETIPGIGEGRDKGKWYIKYNIFDAM